MTCNLGGPCPALTRADDDDDDIGILTGSKRGVHLGAAEAVEGRLDVLLPAAGRVQGLARPGQGVAFRVVAGGGRYLRWKNRI